MIQTKKEIAYSQLRQKMVCGDLAPGSRLTEVALAQEIAVSRGPLREAIQQLASEGLVEISPGMGAYIKRPNRNEIHDLFEAREALESFAAAKAASSASEDQIQEMDDTLKTMLKILHEFRRNGIWEESQRRAMLTADIRFHEIIVRIAGNQRIQKIVSDCQMLRSIVDYNHSLALAQHSTVRSKAVTCLYHARILRAIKRRDADAARLFMAEHVRIARTKALATFERWQTLQANGAH